MILNMIAWTQKNILHMNFREITGLGLSLLDTWLILEKEIGIWLAITVRSP